MLDNAQGSPHKYIDGTVSIFVTSPQQFEPHFCTMHIAMQPPPPRCRCHRLYAAKSYPCTINPKSHPRRRGALRWAKLLFNFLSCRCRSSIPRWSTRSDEWDTQNESAVNTIHDSCATSGRQQAEDVHRLGNRTSIKRPYEGPGQP